MVENVELDITCPGCGHKNVTTIRKLKAHPALACSKCNELLDIDIEELIGAVQKAVQDTKEKHAKGKLPRRH